MRIIAFLFGLGPILFGIGFVAPVTAALLGAVGVHAPFGLTSIQFGLILGFVLGLFAYKRRTWLW